MSKRYKVNQNILHLIMLLTFVVSSPSTSGVPGDYDGVWRASMVDKKEGRRTGVVEIDGQAGFWKLYSICVPAKCACRSLRAPIAVKTASPDKLVFEVLKSKVLRGCKDHTVRLKRLNGSTLEGKLGKENRLELKRK